MSVTLDERTVDETDWTMGDAGAVDMVATDMPGARVGTMMLDAETSLFTDDPARSISATTISHHTLAPNASPSGVLRDQVPL
jgi:hypothetical protein